ncbi:radical SAM protein with 4Fe4S-binding SPASM domain [Paenibacillus sp. PvP094]|uniref:radical SAM/SPASM domain-containing protein n=1 Tax=Paenibacillus sp. PvP094 TaxID=3156394 RepID=UPI003396038E
MNRLKEAIVTRRGNIAVYHHKGEYIIHNLIKSSWVVLDKDQNEIATRYLFDFVTKDQLLLDYNQKEVNQVLNLLNLYRISEEIDKDIQKNNFILSNKVTKPKTVYFVSTYKCNLSCIYCYADSGPTRSMKEDLTTEEAKKVIREIKDLGTEIITFTGGEAFLRKDMMELIEYSKDVGLLVNLISNGAFIQNIDMARKLSSLTNLITISLDSLKKEEHDANRGKGAWRLAMRAIELLLEAGGKLKINQTVTKNNLDAVEDIIDYARKTNSKLVVVPLAGLGRGKQNNYELNYTQRLQYESTVMNKYHSQGLAVKQFNLQQHCGHGLSEFSIDSRGNVYPCKLMHESSFLAGNIKDNDLAGIYNDSHVFKESRDRHVDNLPTCKSCSFKYMCGGGCRAIQWSDTNKVNGTNTYECEFIKMNFIELMWRYFRESKKEAKANVQTVSN